MMAKLIKAKPTIIKLTMVKLFVFTKLLMAKLAIIKLNMVKKMME
jgi:hypothetical protein